MLILEVEDDGPGMTQERLNEVRESLENGNIEGFGLRAVHQRIRILFGVEYGLSVESTEDIGTKITVTIPMKTIEESSG